MKKRLMALVLCLTVMMTMFAPLANATEEDLLSRHLGVFADDGGDPPGHAVSRLLGCDHLGKLADRRERNVLVQQLRGGRTHKDNGSQQGADTVDRCVILREQRADEIRVVLLEECETQLLLFVFVCVADYLGEHLVDEEENGRLVGLSSKTERFALPRACRPRAGRVPSMRATHPCIA